jgi:hypothetical protein
MDPSLHAGNERRVKTLDFTRQTSTKNGKDSSIDRKGHDHRFLRFKRHNLHRLFIWKGEERSHGKFDDPLKEKWPHLRKKKLLFHQANAPAH